MFPNETINGTTNFSLADIDEKHLPKDSRRRLLALAQVDFSHFTLDAAPRHPARQSAPRPEVTASLERSMQEHAPVWAELARH